MAGGPERRKWAAQALADRITTATKAKARIRELGRMIGRHQRKIRSEEIMIKKLRKEERILRERFGIERERRPEPEAECIGDVSE